MGLLRWITRVAKRKPKFVGQADWVSCGVHGPGYSGEAGLVNNHYFSNVDATGWHTYSAERREGVVEFGGGRVYRT